MIDMAFVFYENGDPPFLPSKRAWIIRKTFSETETTW